LRDVWAATLDTAIAREMEAALEGRSVVSAIAPASLRSIIRQLLAKLMDLAGKPIVVDVLLLATTVWVAHFYHFRSLGLYEDDYTHTSPALGWHVSDLASRVIGSFTYWNLGRPLGFALGALLSFLGAQLGGLPGMYVLAFLIHTVNAALFYLLLARMGQRGIGLIGAMLFALFPADTTHPFLMHSFGLHTSLTFLLLASHAYFSARKAVAYLLALCCLLIYETPYAVFLGIPLLLQPWDRKLPQVLLKHAGFWLGILGAVLAVRIGLGEGRVAELGEGATSFAVTLQHIAAAMVIGPAVSLGRFWQGPMWVVAHWDPELTLVFAFGMGIFVWMLLRAAPRVAAAGSSIRAAGWVQGSPGDHRPGLSEAHRQTLKLLAIGLLLLALAYGFSFTHFPPVATAGRLTSVHLAGTFGGALLGAALLWLCLQLIRPRAPAMLAVVVMAAFLGLLLAYSFSVQEAFAASWHNERRFWSRLLTEVPDAGDGTVILVSDHGLPRNPFIHSNSWSDPLVLQQIFDYPSSWSSPPRVFVVAGNWADGLTWGSGQVTWWMPAATWAAHMAVLPEGNTVLLRYVRGSFRRIARPIEVEGHPFALKSPRSTSETTWPKGPLYQLLVGGAE
jgi:hypothetical protein